MREFQGLSFANLVRKQADQKTNFGIGTVRRCFSQSKYNLCYIPVHVQSFFGKTFSAQGEGGRGNITPPLPNPAQSKYNRHNQNTIVQSKYNHTIQIKSQNPNTIDTIQIQLT